VELLFTVSETGFSHVELLSHAFDFPKFSFGLSRFTCGPFGHLDGILERSYERMAP
jgi:hypothetical protein